MRFCLILVVLLSCSLSAPIRHPSVFPAKTVANLLTSARYGGSSCVIGQYLVVAGGEPATTTVDVIDMAAATQVATTTLSSGHSSFSAAPLNGNGCLLVAGKNETGGLTDAVHLVSIDVGTGAITGVTTEENYIRPVSDLSCLSIGTDVWCFGGDNGNPLEETYVGHFNGTNWISSSPMPLPWNFEDTTQGGKCVYLASESKVYCAGAKSNPIEYQIFDPVTEVWDVLLGGRGSMNNIGVAVVDYPSQRLVVWGGATTDLQVIQNGAVTFSSPSVVQYDIPTAQYGQTTFGISNLAVGFSPASFMSVPLLTTFYIENSVVVSGPYVPMILPEWYPLNSSIVHTANSAFSGVFSQDFARMFFCGGNDVATGPLSACWYFDLGCTGAATRGFDNWVSNSTFQGCDITCNAGYYGSDCLPCNCNGQGCDDGYSGTGACVCPAGSYGDCSKNCSGHGVPSTPNGPCLCTTGYSGPDCSIQLNCTNGTWSQQGCVCLPGYYGLECTNECDCSGSPCSDGNTGNGECFCSPGRYTIAATGNCSGTCNCVHGNCADGNDGNGACECASGYYGAACDQQCTCPPVVYSPTQIKIYRCDDGASGTGACIRLYSSASMATSLFALISICLALLFL